MKQSVKLVLVLSALVCLAGCTTTHTMTPYSPDVGERNVTEWQHRLLADPAQRPLQSGDRVVIRLLGIPTEQQFDYVIDDQGSVKLPHIGSVRIAGHNLREAESIVEQSYIAQEIYTKLAVSIVTLSAASRLDQCFVRGEVRRPDAYPLVPNMTLTQAITAAGAFTEFANKRKVQITRDGKRVFYNVVAIEKGEAPDPPVLPGDNILVHRRWGI